MRPPLELIKAFAERGIPATRALQALRTAGYAIRTQTFLNIYRELEKREIAEIKLRYLRFDKIIPEEYFTPTSAIWTGRKYRVQGLLQVKNVETGEIEFRPFVFTTNQSLTRGSIFQFGRRIFYQMTEFTNLELLNISTEKLYRLEEEF
jgi:hypothetical protein